jgi:hypothetical protein
VAGDNGSATIVVVIKSSEENVPITPAGVVQFGCRKKVLIVKVLSLIFSKLSVALTVNRLVISVIEVGVPDISPVTVLKVRPGLRVPDTIRYTILVAGDTGFASKEVSIATCEAYVPTDPTVVIQIG